MEAIDNKSAIGVLTFLGEMYDQAAGFSRLLSSGAGVTGTTSLRPTFDVVCRNYRSGLSVDMWLEVTLQNEDTLAWLMDITAVADGWIVDTRVCKIGVDGTNTLFQLPDSEAPDFNAVRAAVPGMLAEIFEEGLNILKKELP